VEEDKKRQRNFVENVSVFERAIVYSSDSVQACRQVLNDVVFYLRDYADKFYLIGGWAVYYLLDRPDRTPTVCVKYMAPEYREPRTTFQIY
jgi:hypothetical protein